MYFQKFTSRGHNEIRNSMNVTQHQNGLNSNKYLYAAILNQHLEHNLKDDAF